MKSKFYKQRWVHKSVLALLKEFPEFNDPVEIIKFQVKEKIKKALTLGWEGPPFCPIKLASILGINTATIEKNSNYDARIITMPNNQLVIDYNNNKPITRINFSICHEIIHTFFPDQFKMIRLRYKNKKKFDPNQELEKLCDIGAAELLMPANSFQKDLEKYGLKLESVKLLSDRYKASKEAIINRMIHLSGIKCAAIIIELTYKPSQTANENQMTLNFIVDGPKPKMRVQYTIRSEYFNIFIPQHKSIPDDSCVYDAVKQNKIIKSKECWEINGLESINIEVMPLSSINNDSPRAVAIIKPN